MNCACFFDVTPFFLENYTSQFDCLVYSDYWTCILCFCDTTRTM
jgi:hypothetical protein